MMNFQMPGPNNPVYANQGQWGQSGGTPKSAQETFDSRMANSRQHLVPIWNSVGNDLWPVMRGSYGSQVSVLHSPFVRAYVVSANFEIMGACCALCARCAQSLSRNISKLDSTT